MRRPFTKAAAVLLCALALLAAAGGYRLAAGAAALCALAMMGVSGTKSREKERGNPESENDAAAAAPAFREGLGPDMAFNRKMVENALRYERRLALVQSAADVVKKTCDTCIDIVGVVPGGSRQIGRTFSLAAGSAGTGIEIGSLNESIGTAVVAVGQDMAGDFVGRRWNVSGIDDRPGGSVLSVMEIMEQTGAREIGQLSANVLKGKVIAGGVNPVIEAMGGVVVRGAEEPEELPEIPVAKPADEPMPEGAKDAEDSHDEPEPEDGGVENTFYDEEEWENRSRRDESSTGVDDSGDDGPSAGGGDSDEDDNYDWR